MAERVNIPTTVNPTPEGIAKWIRDAATIMNSFMNQTAESGTFFIWDRGCLNVPTNTTISGAEIIVFDSPFVGNGTIVVTGFDFEGGVHIAINDVDLGALTAASGIEALFEIAVTNLVIGINTFKIWSTTADAGELRRIEAYRNFAKEQIDGAGGTAVWGSITGAGKPEDNADVTASRFGSLLLNGSFETGDAEGWSLESATVNNDPTNAHQGTFVLRVASAVGGPDQQSIFIPVKTGDRILATCWTKRDETSLPGANSVLRFREFDGSKVQGTVESGVGADKTITGYQHLRNIYIVVDADAEFVRIDFDGGNGPTGHWFVDEFTFALLPKDIDIDALGTLNAPAEANALAAAPNLFGADANITQIDTHRYLDKVLIDDLPVLVGDAIGASVEINDPDVVNGRVTIKFWTSGDVQVGPNHDGNLLSSTSGFEKSKIDNLIVPATTAKITVISQYSSSGGGDYQTRYAMFNRGPVAALFVPAIGGAGLGDDIDFANVVGGTKPEDNATLNTGDLADLDIVDTVQIAADAIETDKINGLAVTTAKVNTDAVNTVAFGSDGTDRTLTGVETKTQATLSFVEENANNKFKVDGTVQLKSDNDADINVFIQPGVGVSTPILNHRLPGGNVAYVIHVIGQVFDDAGAIGNDYNLKVANLTSGAVVTILYGELSVQEIKR